MSVEQLKKSLSLQGLDKDVAKCFFCKREVNGSCPQGRKKTTLSILRCPHEARITAWGARYDAVSWKKRCDKVIGERDRLFYEINAKKGPTYIINSKKIGHYFSTMKAPTVKILESRYRVKFILLSRSHFTQQIISFTKKAPHFCGAFFVKSKNYFCASRLAWAAATIAMGTRNGEQLT